MSEKSKFSMNVEWSEGNDGDFEELREAVKNKQTQRNFESASSCDDTGDEISDTEREAVSNKEVVGYDDSNASSDEDHEPPDQPGPKFLWAAQHNDIEVLKSLLESDTNLMKFVDSDQYTALHRAAYSGSHEALVFLLRNGADVSAETADGYTPLHSACRWNMAACAETLLAWGADVNKVTNGGQTPLHLAAFIKNSKQTLLVLLLHPKLKPMTKNCQGDTPYDIARRNGNSVDALAMASACFTVPP